MDEGVLLEEDEGVEEWSSRAWPATQPRRKTGSLEIGWPVVTHISWWGSRKVVIGARFSLITMLWRVLMRGVILPTGRIACAIL